MLRRATGMASAMGCFRRPAGAASSDETQDRIQAAEQHFRLAQEAGGIGTWEWRLGTGDMLCSAQMLRNLGLCTEATEADRVASVANELLLSAAHPEDRARVAALLAEYSIRPGPMRIEYRIVRPDGAVRWIVLLGNVTLDEHGSPATMLGISIDSTHRREIVETADAV